MCCICRFLTVRQDERHLLFVGGDGGLAAGATVTARAGHARPRHVPMMSLQRHRLLKHHGKLLSENNKYI